MEKRCVGDKMSGTGMYAREYWSVRIGRDVCQRILECENRKGWCQRILECENRKGCMPENIGV